MAKVAVEKAKEILRDGKVHGKPLTKKQRGFFGAAAGGNLKKAKDGALPEDLDPNEDNIILVGDGGKDPAAEEYVFLPKGSSAIIAPKMDATEKPGMSNAVKAIANTALKGKLKKAQYGSTVGLSNVGSGVVNSRGLSVRRPNEETGLPSIPAPAPPVIPGGPARPAAPYDPGVELETAISLLDTLEGTMVNPVVSGADQFARRPGVTFAAARHGAMKMLDKKLKKAQYGTISQPFLNTPVSYQPPAASSTPSRVGQGTRAATVPTNAATQLNPNSTAQNAAQRAIAQLQADTQMKIAEMTNRANMERIALDRLLGQQQLDIDRQSARDQAMQLLATRAGRQMVAPGGNVIPSMQPSLGRGIN